MTRPVIARPRRAGPILICRKCLKRCAKGDKIRRALKHALKERPHRSVKQALLVPTGCFDLCPKRAVVLASGPSLREGEYVLVSRPREIEDALLLLK